MYNFTVSVGQSALSVSSPMQHGQLTAAMAHQQSNKNRELIEKIYDDYDVFYLLLFSRITYQQPRSNSDNATSEHDALTVWLLVEL